MNHRIKLEMKAREEGGAEGVTGEEGVEPEAQPAAATRA